MPGGRRRAMTKLEIAAIYAGVNLLLLVVLAVRVANYRRTKRIPFGDGADPALLRRVRIHGNAAEFIPAGIAGLIFLALLDPIPAWLVQTAGVALTAGRLLHAYALSQAEGAIVGRAVGMLLTLAALVVAGIGSIWAALSPLL